MRNIIFFLFVLSITICSCNKASNIDYPNLKSYHSFNIGIDTLSTPYFTSRGILIGTDVIKIMCNETGTDERQIIKIHRYNKVVGNESYNNDFYIYLDRVSEFTEYLSEIFAEYRKNKVIIKENNINNAKIEIENICNLNSKTTNGLIDNVRMVIDDDDIHTILIRPISENNYENFALSIKNEKEFQFLLLTLQKDKIDKIVQNNKKIKSLFY